MNGLALTFITGAFLPVLAAPAVPVKAPHDIETVEVVLDSMMASEEDQTAAPSAAVPPAEEPPDATPASPPLEPSPWRSMPEIIEPRPVVEPPPRPALMPAEPPPRPAPPADKPARSKTTGTLAPPKNAGTPPGANGSRPGGPTRAAGNGQGLARGTTPDPPYPVRARRDRIQGTLELGLTIVDGRVSQARLIRSSNSALLDESALNFVQRAWKWPPGINGTFTRKITFKLQ
jgi:protein TonB